MAKNDKLETVSIGEYLVAKDGKTKYIKLQCNPKASAEVKKLVEDLKALVGDVFYVNLFDEQFRAKHNIPEFSRGRINVPAPGTAKPSTANTEDKAEAGKDEVDF